IKLRCYLSRIDNSSIEGAGNIFDINYFDKLFNSLSAGMKQKVSLTIPFLAHNDLILLDEPTNHLDIDSIIILRNKILKLREEGVSFLIASHGFSELEKVCDRVIFIKNRKILCNERSSDLLLKFNDFENAYQSIISNYKA
ncbi:MAG: ATP-binding cassette domain-containing protein, partial [Dolichospermum sp.]